MILSCAACGDPFVAGGRGHPKITSLFCSRSCSNRARIRSGKLALELSSTDRAYLAGLVDGEGCIMAQMRNSVVAIRMTIVNRCKPALDWVTSTTGVGAIHIHKKADARHQTCYVWQAESEAVGGVLRQIRDYLKIKQAQADLAILILERLSDPLKKLDRTWHLPMRDQMCIMNVRGNPALVRSNSLTLT